MDDRNTSNGDGALASGGWSVATVNLPKCASTRESPGKSISNSIFIFAPVSNLSREFQNNISLNTSLEV
jgi:hypothetical protein